MTPDHWENLSYTARIRLAVEIGQRSRTSPADADTLRQWEAGTFDRRLAAAFAGYGSWDMAALLRLCADPSGIVSRTALHVLGTVGDDDSLLAGLRLAPPRRRPAVLDRLCRRRRPVVDRFLTELISQGEEPWPLLPLASADLLGRHFETAAERGGLVFWKRLAARHPHRAVAAVRDRLAASTTPDGRLDGAGQMVAAKLASTHPDLALSLREHLPIANLPLATLVKRRPDAVAEIVLGSTVPVQVTFEGVAGRLSPDRLIALFRHRPGLLRNEAAWLRRLSPADRLTVFRELSPAWVSSFMKAVSAEVIALLPTMERVAEARKAIAKPDIAADVEDRLDYAALLPWDEVRTECQPWLNHPEADIRSVALKALCRATRFDRSRLGELLEVLAGRKFEQDPVRQQFLGVVAHLPPGRWREEHLPGLATLIRDALDAADLSGVGVFGSLLGRILPFHPDWATEQLALVTAERGFPGLSTGHSLTLAEVRRIAPALTPVLQAWAERENVSAILAVASAMGQRLPDWPELMAILEQMTLHSAAVATSFQAMALLVRHARADRERIILSALTADPSWGIRPEVYTFLHRHRQDLLTPFLGRRLIRGRIHSGNTRPALPFADGFWRWTAQQQETFADTLVEVASQPPNETQPQVTWDINFAVRRLAELPAVGPERLARFADDPRVAVRETAVRALGRFDARQGVPLLLEALGDARARWAIYALRSALSEMSADRVMSTLRAAPMNRVTVAKEALRLAGEFGGASALTWLIELDGQKLHRDVRGAMLRALWDHLERPEAWEIIDRNAESSEVGVVIGLARMPTDRLSESARARVTALMRRLLAHREPTVRSAVLDRLFSNPLPDPERDLLADVLGFLGSNIADERSSALWAALRGGINADSGRFVEAFRRLLSQRREFAEAIEHLVSRSGFRERLRDVFAGVFAVVDAEPTFTVQAVPLACHQPVNEFIAWVTRLAETPRWHVGVQLAVRGVLVEWDWPADTLDVVEKAWQKSKEPTLRWLGLQALLKLVEEHGWTDATRQRLGVYQRDESPTVADAATWTFPPD